MQLTADITVFTDNYLQLQVVTKRLHNKGGDHSEQYNPREIRFLYTMITLVNLL